MGSIRKSVNLLAFYEGRETSGSRDIDLRARINGQFRGVSFSFSDGDVISFPAATELRAYFAEGFKTVGLVIRANVNGREVDVPLYALRKTPKGLVDAERSAYDEFRANHPLYAALTISPKSDLQAFVDEDLFGRSFRVEEQSFTCGRGDGDEYREFSYKCWALVEAWVHPSAQLRLTTTTFLAPQ